MASEELNSISIQCPCCKAELVVDMATRSVLHHAPHAVAPMDFAAELNRLQAAPAEREKAFQRSLEAQRGREASMDRKFDELLRRAKESPTGKPLKDIDL